MDTHIVTGIPYADRVADGPGCRVHRVGKIQLDYGDQGIPCGFVLVARCCPNLTELIDNSSCYTQRCDEVDLYSSSECYRGDASFDFCAECFPQGAP